MNFAISLPSYTDSDIGTDACSVVAHQPTISRRTQLTQLGRHLHRSLLRLCVPVDLLHEWLNKVLSRERALQIALDRVSAADPRAGQLQVMVDAWHSSAVAAIAKLDDPIELQAHWETARVGMRPSSRELVGAYWALVMHPAATRQLRHLAFGDMEMLHPDAARLSPLALTTGRRSPSPRFLAAPGPNELDVEHMVEAALAAPDHGRLRPWRIVTIPSKQRATLADLFEQEKIRRSPHASRHELDRSREHALAPPCLLAFVVSLQEGSVPSHEQWLAAGAALGNFVTAAHALDFPAVVRSGDRCKDPTLCQALGVRVDETLAGFVSIGSSLSATALVRHIIPTGTFTAWQA